MELWPILQLNVCFAFGKIWYVWGSLFLSSCCQAGPQCTSMYSWWAFALQIHMDEKWKYICCNVLYFICRSSSDLKMRFLLSLGNLGPRPWILWGILNTIYKMQSLQPLAISLTTFSPSFTSFQSNFHSINDSKGDPISSRPMHIPRQPSRNSLIWVGWRTLHPFQYRISVCPVSSVHSSILFPPYISSVLTLRTCLSYLTTFKLYSF